MIDEDEALARILMVSAPLEAESLPLAACLGRCLNQAAYASFALPRFASSSVDGYALPAAAQIGDQFRVVGEQPAGQDRGLRISPGETARVFTGAPLPSGTQAIAMQEDVEAFSDTIRLTEAVSEGEHCRRIGEDLCQGQKLMDAGVRLRPQHLALLASQGIEKAQVARQPRVTIITTGDELVSLGQPLQPGQIYESNGLMLEGLCREVGLTTPTREHVKDDPKALRAAVETHLGGTDIFLISGGVSVGDHDHVKPVMNTLGMRQHFWKVRVKPGKPLLFGSLGKTLVFGLPGNPGASFVCFWLFCLPAIKRLMGCTHHEQPRILSTLMTPVSNPGDRPHYLLGRWEPHDNTFYPLSLRSFALHGLSGSNALGRLLEHSRGMIGAQIDTRIITIGMDS